MAKGDIEKDMVFYIIIMLIVLYVGASIVLGFNPAKWAEKGTFSQSFEPGKLRITNANDVRELENLVKFDCSGAVQILILNDAMFKSDAGSKKNLDFIILLDYANRLFPGTDNEDVLNTIRCALSDDNTKFNCQGTVRFKLQGVVVSGKQIFHFTTWSATQPVLDDMNNGGILSNMLEAHPESYLSSFDVVLNNVEYECKKTECSSISSAGECMNKNADGCYWSTPWSIPWLSKCEACPDFTDCTKYDSDSCVQCPTPVLNCHLGDIRRYVWLEDQCVPN